MELFKLQSVLFSAWNPLITLFGSLSLHFSIGSLNTFSLVDVTKLVRLTGLAFVTSGGFWEHFIILFHVVLVSFTGIVTLLSIIFDIFTVTLAFEC